MDRSIRVVGRVLLFGAMVLIGCGGKSETIEGGGASESGGSSATGGGGGATGGTGGSRTGGTGGVSASGGDAGTVSGTGGAGTGGVTQNIYISQIRNTVVDKIDLLFMIDNSLAMGDKQRLLADALPPFLARLVQPRCVDAERIPTGVSAPCPAGSAPEFKVVDDIHVGVITSSLGDHGSADVCSEATVVAGSDTTYNDKAQLVPTVYSFIPQRAGLASWNGQGFLVWDPRAPDGDVVPHMPPGYGSPLVGGPGDTDAFIDAFVDHVTAAGEHGCGYEAQLESWYRFLIDPEPVDFMANDGQVSVRGAVNQTVLAQRAAFLRPDSLLAIVMLTDENDCSILDENQTQGWLVPFKGGPTRGQWRMPRAHAICATRPNDPTCVPCGSEDPDPGCAAGPYTPADDAPNVRCYRQKQRFGIDFLYPIQRYVAGLTEAAIDPRFTGNLTENPLFAPGAGGELPRDPSLVLLAGVVGVPWQDIATEDSLSAPRDLEYMTADDLAANERWDVIVGDPDNAVNPTDPFMIEAIDPRPTGATNPVYPGAAVTDSSATNPINGHEQAVIPTERADLQFACVFPLVTPVPCDVDNESSCECNADEYAKNSPLCDYPDANLDGTQVRAKAYPSIRELAVLKGIGPNAIVASVCPKNTGADGTPTIDPSYGYNPALGALIDRMAGALREACLPRPLTADTDPASPDFGTVPCSIVEVEPAGGAACACDPESGRLDVASADLSGAVREHLVSLGYCREGELPLCDYCFCEIRQFEGPDLDACRTEADLSGPPGYCYLDEAAGADPALLADCPTDQKRRLRFVGDDVPHKDALAFVACY